MTCYKFNRPKNNRNTRATPGQAPVERKALPRVRQGKKRSRRLPRQKDRHGIHLSIHIIHHPVVISIVYDSQFQQSSIAFYIVLPFCGMLRWKLIANNNVELYTDENRSNTSHGRQSILETVPYNPWAVHE